MKRILVVDDSVLMLDIVRDALEEAGFQVATAKTVDELTTYDGSAFDVILMDVQMPELYGDDIASVLKARGTRARIMLFSNLPPDELAARAAEAELDGYFSKKDGIEALVAKMREMIP